MHTLFRLAVAVVVLLGAEAAHAQLRSIDTHVFVTFRNGASLDGSLVNLGVDAVVVVVNGTPRTIPLADVERIERDGDPTGDGATKGGVILGLMCALVCGQGMPSGSHHLAGIVTNAAIGAFFGWRFDRDHHGRTTIYPLNGERRATASVVAPAPSTPPVPPESSTPPQESAGPDEITVASAPSPTPPQKPRTRRHAISVNPFGLGFGHAAAEYERRVAPSLGVGFVAARTIRPSVWVGRDEVRPDAREVLTDAVVRLYPGRRVFSGIAVGLRAGVGTTTNDRELGVGYDLAYTWTLDERGYVSLGVGQERVAASRGLRPSIVFWPTTRLNVGITF